MEGGQGDTWEEDLVMQAMHSERESSPMPDGRSRDWHRTWEPSLPASSLQPPPLWGLRAWPPEGKSVRVWRSGCPPAWGLPCVGRGGNAHLVKEAELADELLPGLGVDGDGEPHMRHQELAGEQRKHQRRPGRAPGLACAPLETPGTLVTPVQSTVEGDRRAWGGSADGHPGLHRRGAAAA